MYNTEEGTGAGAQAKKSGDTDYAARLHALFDGSDRGHYVHGEPSQEPDSTKWQIKNVTAAVHRALTVDDWRGHLGGEISLVPIPVRGDGKCKFGSIDVDEYDANSLKTIAKAESLELPLVACWSKSGGLHLFLFLQEWTDAAPARQLLQYMAMRLRLPDAVEIFPKQDSLKDDEIGNGICAPYARDFGGKLKDQRGLKKTGAAMEPAEFLRCAEERRLTPADFDLLLAKAKKPAKRQSMGVGAGPTDAEIAADHIKQTQAKLAAFEAEIAACGVNRNNLLFRRAAEIGNYLSVEVPGIDEIESEAVEALLRAGQACGLDHSEVLDVVLRAIKRGKREPRMLHADMLLNEMNDRYAVVQVEGKVCVMYWEESRITPGYLEPQFQSRRDFEAFHCNRFVRNGEHRKPIGKWWFEHRGRRQYSGAVYAPGEETPGKFNFWQGFAYEPRPGDCSLFLEHVKEVICSDVDEHFNWLLGHMADIVQNPDRASGVAVVLRSKEHGTGKGVVATQFGRLFGPHFMHALDAEHMVGRFNAHLERFSLVFADEAFFAGNRAHVDKLKGMITERTLFLERKGFMPYTARNCLNFFLASNHDHVVDAASTERRSVVFDVSDQYRGNHAYFGAIIKQMEEDGGDAALLHALLHHNLDGFSAQALPQTEGLAKQKMFSRRGIDRAIETWAQQGTLPSAYSSKYPNVAITTGEDVGKGLYVAIRKTAPDLQYVPTPAIIHMLCGKTDNGKIVEAGWGCTSQSVRVGRRTYRGMAFPALAELRRMFDERHGPQDWDDSITEWQPLGGDDEDDDGRGGEFPF